MSSDAQTLTAEIRAIAEAQGFSQIGVAPAVTPSGFHRLLDWLQKGFAAGMSWIERRREAYRHPDGVMSGTRSLIVLTMNYHDSAPAHPGGRIARYARSRTDYHDVLKRRMKPIVSRIAQLVPGARCRTVVDSAPLLERDFARLAGIGWFGKNTMLISRTNGSWFFLGVILTDQVLVYDEPEEKSYCGTCTRCLEACPTRAFPEPGVLDAGRCISYLTIEHRNEAIPRHLVQDIGSWVFGCDVCQDVCPWNRFAPNEVVSELRPDADFSGWDEGQLLRILSMTPDEVTSFLAGTPMARTGRDTIVRNVIIACANLPVPAAIPILRNLTTDSASIVRTAASWALEASRLSDL